MASDIERIRMKHTIKCYLPVYRDEQFELELEHCPFCHGSPVMCAYKSKEYAVNCNCGARGPKSYIIQTAVNGWNLRGGR